MGSFVITYVLILVMSGNGKSVTSLEFSGEQACNNAKEMILEKTQVQEAVCVPKFIKE